MAKNITRTELRKQDFLVLRKSRDGTVTNVIAPNGLQVGLSDADFGAGLKVKGVIDAEGGLRFSDGTILSSGASSVVVGRTKTQTVLTQGYAALSTVSLGAAAKMDTIGTDTDSFIDLFHNQKLMLSGSVADVTTGDRDYYIDPGANAVVFSFPSLTNDTVSTIVISSGSAAVIGAGQGLSQTGGVLDIELTANGGLEFSNSKLQLDIKSGGGLALTSNELLVDIDNFQVLSSGLDSTNDKIMVWDDSVSALKAMAPSLIAASYAALDIASVSNSLNEGTLASGDLLGVADVGGSNEVKKITIEDFGDYLAAGTNAGIGSSTGKLTIDLNDLSGAVVAVNADSIAIIDASDNSSKKESIADLITAVAGTVTSTGLVASSGVLNVSISGQTDISTAVATGDFLLLYDASASALKKVSVNNLQSASSAPPAAQYVVLSTDATLSGERVLTAGDGITTTDAGAGSTVTLATDLKSSGGLVFDSGEIKVDYGATAGQSAQGSNTLTIVAGDGLKSGGTATLGTAATSVQLDIDVADFAGTGLSASGNNLHAYLAGGSNIQITTGSDGHLVIGATGLGAGDITEVTAGVGLSGGGTTGAVSLALDVSELTALGATAATTDYIVIQDVTDNSTKKVLISNLPGDIQAITAGSGISGGGSSGTINLDLDVTELTEVATGAPGDFIVIQDVTDDTTKKVRVSNLTGAGIDSVAAGTGLQGGGSSGAIALSIVNSVVATLTGSVFSGHVGVTGSLEVVGGLSGSLTHLSDGSSYLIAGSNITIVSGSTGAITVSSTDGQDVFKTISVSGQSDIVADSTTDALTLVAGSNVTITTDAGSDTITIASTDTNTTYSSSDFNHDNLTGFVANEHIDWTANQGATNIHAGNYTDTNTTYTAGGGLDLSGTTFILDLKSGSGLVIDSTELSINDSVLATISGSVFSGHVGVTGSIHSTTTVSGSLLKANYLTGSLTHLSDGSSYLVAGSNITIVSGSAGAVTISASSAATNAFSTLAVSGQNNVVADSTTDTLTLVGGSNVSISTDAGTDTITITSTDTDTTYTAGAGLDLSAAEFGLDLKSGGGLKIVSAKLSINDAIVATLSGSQFSGNIGITGSLGVTGGLSGSLTHLSDGSSYLIAGSNVALVTGSSGAITVSSTDTNTTYSSSDFTHDDLIGFVANEHTNWTQASAGTIHATNYTDTNTQLTTEQVQDIVGDMVDDTETGITVTYDDINGNLEFVVSDTTVAGDSGSTGITPGDTLTIAGGTNVTTSMSGDTLTITAAGGSISAVSGSTSISDVSTFNFDNFGLVQDIGSNTVALTGSIGQAEEGTYTDGLFTDFSPNTTVGTAIDRFNEVLKGLAPPAASSMDDASCADSGASAKLSFGSSQSISGYTNAIPSGLTPTDNLSDININGTYSSVITSNDVRVACFDGTTVINGTLNDDISADGVNYVADSFGNGNQGTLKLYVNNNSTQIHSVDLSSFGSGNSLNGDSSGFNLSAATPGHFADSSNFDTFQHRQGTYTITAASQRNGWNYARITHTVGSSTTTTNYIEWINDPDSNALAQAGSVMDSLSMTGTKNLSGAKYNTGGTAKYRIRVTNAYRNVYSTSNITFSETNCSIPNKSFLSIDHASGEDETKTLHLTGSVTITGDPILNGSISARTSVPHPLKSNLSNVGSQSISGILLYDLSDTSSVVSETFRGESYRLISGSYVNQAAVTAGGNAWDSTTSLATVDGLLYYNSRLYVPTQGGVSGDFRNTADGGSITNGPSSNVNYSGLTSGTKTFYRKFQNNSGGSKTNFDLTINGSGTIVSHGTAFSSSRVKAFVKLPTTTSSFASGWMDLATAFSTGQVSDGDGCLVGSLDSSLNATNEVTFGTQSVGDDEYIVVIIKVDASFTGYVTSMSVSWS